MDTPSSLYAKAHLLTTDGSTAAALTGMKQLSSGWTEQISPAPVHKLLAQKLPVPEGRKQHESILLQLARVDTDTYELTVNHARFWQFMSMRFLPANPQGLLQFQMELSVILEELAKEKAPQKPLLQIVSG